jgi:restriction system protein
MNGQEFNLTETLFQAIWLAIKNIFLETWWIFLLFAIISILAVIIKAKIDKKRYSNITKIHSGKDILSKLKSLHPNAFEEYIEYLFNQLGYKAERVGRAYDGGIDVIAKKDNIKHYIQCKKFITSQVSVSEVRDFYGALTDHLANGKGYFITTNKFTLEAEKFAENKPIELIDGHRLLDYIEMAKLDHETYFNKEEEKCPQCSGKLVERNGKYGKFWGCSNYPKCKFTKK